jgi:Holliday junction resolvase RusA-like endonuclease
MDLVLGEKRLVVFEKTVKMRPVPKASVRVNKNGHAYYPKRTKDAMKLIRDETIAAKNNLFLEEGFRSFTNKDEPLFTEAVRVWLIFAFQYPKGVEPWQRPHHDVKPDIDNLAKLALDAIQPHIIQDDCLIVELHKKKIYSDSEFVKFVIEDL